MGYVAGCGGRTVGVSVTTGVSPGWPSRPVRPPSTSGSFRQNAVLPWHHRACIWGIESRPRDGDCFVALRAPRNDSICRLTIPLAVIASEAKQSPLAAPADV